MSGLCAPASDDLTIKGVEVEGAKKFKIGGAMKKVKKEAQKELPGMPEMSDLGKAAAEYLNARDEKARFDVHLETKRQALAEEFRKSGKRSIKISGYVLTMSEQEQVRISVKEA